MANWIKGAIKHPGALTKKAKAAGKTVKQFEKAHKNAKGKLGKQITLAKTLSKLRKKK